MSKMIINFVLEYIFNDAASAMSFGRLFQLLTILALFETVFMYIKCMKSIYA